MTATKENPIIFYDLTGKDGISWSPNTYKTRLTLNYKGLPYRVEKLSFPDIQAKYKELGITSAPYTLPLIADPSSEPNSKPTYVSDSFKIAVYLDDKYPAPQYPVVFPPGTRALQHLIVTEYYPTVAVSLAPLISPSVPERLDERGAEYWYRTRGNRFQPPTEEAAAKLRQEVAQKWDGIAKSLDFNNNTAEPGPFLMGNQISFADFAIGGVFHFFQQIQGEDSVLLGEMMRWQGGRWKGLRDRFLSIERNSSEVV
ncbi:hypothetical protein FRC09_011112 [Ceratobasidium sp. 395]|nr:hypothetical protein FRC09_011112 [Ceratobasidium sp. 395]